MAGNSTDPIGGAPLHTDDHNNPSLVLAMQLQAEDDEQLARQLMEEMEACERVRRTSATATSSSTNTPVVGHINQIRLEMFRLMFNLACRCTVRESKWVADLHLVT